MNISKQEIDNLNAVLTVGIDKDDYAGRVEKVLKDYRKNADVPGFRKGNIPMGMIKKQYGQAVMVEEVNKLLQETLNNYIKEEKLDLLGQPLPKEGTEVDWSADNFNFEFEIGLAPEFEVNLEEEVTQYKIVATEKMIDDQVASIQKQYGSLQSAEVVAEGYVIAGKFENAENEIEKDASLEFTELSEAAQKLFLGAKVNDVVTVNTQELFENNQFLVNLVGIAQEDKDEANFDVNFTINEVNERILAELDQELFDKLFGEGEVKTVTELKEKIKEDAEKQFEQHAAQNFLNKVTDNVVENTKFDLPAEFLKKWLRVAGEKPLTEEEANAEYEKSEKGLRYQLIEGKIFKDNNLEVSYVDLQDRAKELIKAQMAQFGNANPSEEEVLEITNRVLSNQEEVQRLSEQIVSEKMLAFFKENVKVSEKEVSFEQFIEEAYKN